MIACVESGVTPVPTLSPSCAQFGGVCIIELVYCLIEIDCSIAKIIDNISTVFVFVCVIEEFFVKYPGVVETGDLEFYIFKDGIIGILAIYNIPCKLLASYYFSCSRRIREGGKVELQESCI